MAAPASAAGGGTRELIVAASGDSEPQNTGAWTSIDHGRSSSAYERDSKRNDAAHLAQELATTTSWSDTFLPQSYGSVPVTESLREHQSNSREANQTREDFDPPPAYSKRPSAPEIQSMPLATSSTYPASSNMRSPQAVGSDTDVAADAEQDINQLDGLPDLEEPLLDNRRRRRRCRRTKKQRLRDWVHRAKDKKGKFVRLLIILAVCTTISFIVLCSIEAIFDKDSKWFQKPAKSSQPLVPTGPDYRLYDPIGSISGLYKLYDRLELKSNTGSIDVEIDPQTGEEPAYLIVSSEIGSINVRVSPEFLSRHKRTRRPIYTEIRTLTGSVSADILLGNGGLAYIDSTLGTQVLNVMTYDVYSQGVTSNITTESTTGTQKILVQSLDRSFITDIHAEHHVSATGSLDIEYPSTWLGEVRLVSSPLGNVALQGDDLEVTKQDREEIIAHRGSVSYRQRVEVISDATGSASFKC